MNLIHRYIGRTVERFFIRDFEIERSDLFRPMMHIYMHLETLSDYDHIRKMIHDKTKFLFRVRRDILIEGEFIGISIDPMRNEARAQISVSRCWENNITFDFEHARRPMTTTFEEVQDAWNLNHYSI